MGLFNPNLKACPYITESFDTRTFNGMYVWQQEAFIQRAAVADAGSDVQQPKLQHGQERF